MLKDEIHLPRNQRISYEESGTGVRIVTECPEESVGNSIPVVISFKGGIWNSLDLRPTQIRIERHLDNTLKMNR